MAYKESYSNAPAYQESHIISIVRNPEGFLVEPDGMFVDPDDRRIVHVNENSMNNRPIDKADTMQQIISRYKQAEAKLQIEEAKKVKNEEKIKHIKKVMKNLAECLSRNEEYIRAHLKLNVNQIIKVKIK